MIPHGSLRHGPLRRGLVVAAGWGLLCAVVAGCGSEVAPTGASTPAGASSASGSALAGGAAAGASASSVGTPAPAGASGSSGSAGAPASAALVGCASVNQATAVSATRLTRLEVPVDGGELMVTDRKPAQAQALFRDFCNAVTHPNPPSAVMRCPADFGTSYSGVFYDGNRVLARYTYDASGCRQVSVITGTMIQSTTLAGPAALAAPHLGADFAAVLTAAKPNVIPTTSNMNRGGTP